MEQTDYRMIMNSVATYLRGTLSTMHLVTEQIMATAAEEADSGLMKNAARLERNFYMLMRLASVLSDADFLEEDYQPRREVTDLPRLVKDVTDEARTLVEGRNLRLRLRVTPKRYLCMVDGHAVRNLLLHLLSNAIQNTGAEGQITVDLRIRQRQALLKVADTGRGMTDVELSAAMLGKYRRLDGTPGQSGMGVGIPLCRRIAERHGGTMMARSRYGEGTTILVSLPAERVSIWEVRKAQTPFFEIDGGFDSTRVGLADAIPSEKFGRKRCTPEKRAEGRYTRRLGGDPSAGE